MTQLNFCQEVPEPKVNNKSGFESHHMALPIVVGKLFHLRKPHFPYLLKAVTRSPLQDL